MSFASNTSLTLRKVINWLPSIGSLRFYIRIDRSFGHTWEPFGNQKYRKPLKLTRKLVDKWISKYGADAPFDQVLVAVGVIKAECCRSLQHGDPIFNEQLEKDIQKQVEKREKGTDEVADTSEDPSDGELHGGDGNSQEVDAPSESENEAAEGQPSADTELSEEDLQGLIEQLDQAELKDTAGNPNRNGYRMSTEPLIQKAQEAIVGKKGKDVRRLVTALEKLFESEMSTDGKDSPRISGKKLATEVVSKRYNLNRCHKKEMDKRPILIMVDTSGSCSAHAGGNLEAAITVQQNMQEHVTVIVHANGYANCVIGTHIELPTDTDNVNWGQWYSSVEWSLIINFGDTDAEAEMLECQKNGAKILLLDSYCAKSGKAFVIDDAAYPHIGGINDTTDAWVALQIYKKTWCK